jgi:hypothetical protein
VTAYYNEIDPFFVMSKYAYYSENDPFKAEVLREAIKDGAIAPGEVDERRRKSSSKPTLKRKGR